MNRIMQIDLADIIPEQKSVFHNLGIPGSAAIPKRIHTLFTEALDMFTASVQPAGLLSEISIDEFEAVFKGEGKNAIDVLLMHIFPNADNLALFALTLGGEISVRIKELFDDNNFALGSMIDAVASSAAERAVEVCESYYFNELSKKNNVSQDFAVLNYSPGYCGWNVSGQKKLFRYLHPERIGISLNDSSLMTPIKSVTGLLVAGKKDIHIIDEGNYSFCRPCKNHTCVERMKKLLL